MGFRANVTGQLTGPLNRVARSGARCVSSGSWLQRFWVRWVAASVLLLTAPASAGAADATTGSTTLPVRDACNSMRNEARKLSEVGQYKASAEIWQRIHARRCFGSDSLYNLTRVTFQAGDCDAALRMLDRLTEPPTQLNDERRAKVAGMRSQCVYNLARVKFLAGECVATLPMLDQLTDPSTPLGDEQKATVLSMRSQCARVREPDTDKGVILDDTIKTPSPTPVDVPLPSDGSAPSAVRVSKEEPGSAPSVAVAPTALPVRNGIQSDGNAPAHRKWWPWLLAGLGTAGLAIGLGVGISNGLARPEWSDAVNVRPFP